MKKILLSAIALVLMTISIFAVLEKLYKNAINNM